MILKGRKQGMATRVTLLAEKYGNTLLALYALCWMLLFAHHSFDWNARFFRIPLLILTLPLLLSLRQQAVFSYLRYAPQAWCVVLMILAGFIAAFFCPFPDVRSFRHLVFGWLILALAGYSIKVALPDKALRLMLLGIVAGLAAALLWALGGVALDNLALENIWHKGKRLELFTGYPNTLGLMTGFALTGQFFFWKHGRRIISPKVDIALLLFTLTLLLLTQTRAPLMAFAIAAGAIVILASQKPLRALGFTLLSGLLLVTALYVLGQAGPLKYSPSYQRMISLISPKAQESSLAERAATRYDAVGGRSGMLDHALAGRLAIWVVATKMAAERPLTGYGMRMFPRASAAYMEKHGDAIRAQYPFIATTPAIEWNDGAGTFGHAHNLGLGALTELGLLGLLPLLGIFIYAFWPGKASRTASCKISGGSDIRCLQMLLLFFAVHGIAEYMLTGITYSDLFFATVGLFTGAMYCEWVARKEA